MIVENAKQHIATAVKTETQLPYVEVNPRIVSSAPAAAPYETGIPLQRITSAVRVQMTMVSVNTSKIPKNPCLTGLRVSAQACAIEPVPRPASLEKIPRDTPFFMLIKKLPTAPPVTEAGVNAPLKIEENTEKSIENSDLPKVENILNRMHIILDELKDASNVASQEIMNDAAE